MAGLLLLVLCHCRKEAVCRKNLVVRSAISGIVLLFIDMAVIMLAQRYVSSSLVAIVASSTAVWIMLLDVPMWKRNFRNLSAAGGILLGFAGVGLLYMEQLGGETRGTHSEYGILLLIGGCLSWALGTLYTKYRSCGTGKREGIRRFRLADVCGEPYVLAVRFPERQMCRLRISGKFPVRRGCRCHT